MKPQPEIFTAQDKINIRGGAKEMAQKREIKSLIESILAKRECKL